MESTTAFWSDIGRRVRAAALPRSPVIDADAHIDESLGAILPHMEPTWRQRMAPLVGGREFYALPYDLGDESVGGRIKRPPRGDGQGIPALEEAQRAMGVACSVVFPTQLLGLGLHPNREHEAAIAVGYARWLTEAVLPHHPTLRAMLYLPLGDAEASLDLVRRFGDRPGVAGFVVTSVRNQAVHENRFMAVYEAIEELDLPLAFHPSPFWRGKQFESFSRFLSAFTISLPLYNMVHLLNVIMHGIPERFPRLRLLFCEAGIAWLPFVMHRVDMEFMKRPSEAPLLRRKPSEYMRDIYFTTHPLEVVDPPHGERLLRMIDAEAHLVYASNVPGWDFDLPDRVTRLPGLTEDGRRAILAGNAARLFRLGEGYDKLSSVEREVRSHG